MKRIKEILMFVLEVISVLATIGLLVLAWPWIKNMWE